MEGRQAVARDYTTSERRWGLTAVLMTSFAVGLHFGVFMPLIAIILEGQGQSAAAIGLNSAMQPLAILIFGAFLTRIIGALGSQTALFGGFAVALTAIPLFPLVPDATFWLALRFLLGLGLALPWLVAETWVNVITREQNRGVVVALYTTAFYLGLAVGPLLLELIGVEGWLPFLVSGATLLLSVLPVALCRRLLPEIPARPRLSLWQSARFAPVVAAAALVSGFVEAALYVLLPIYGLRSGLDQSQAVTMLTFFMAGALLLQVPLGYLADRAGRGWLFVLSLIGSIFCAALMPFLLADEPWRWALLVVWGGMVTGFYTLGLAILGQRFAPGDLAAANALFIVCFEAGHVAGPVLGGWAMDLWRPHGLLLVVALAAAVTLTFAIEGKRPRPRAKGGTPPPPHSGHD